MLADFLCDNVTVAEPLPTTRWVKYITYFLLTNAFICRFEKWQQRWEASSTGRHLFEFRESVRARSTRSTVIKIQKIITQLRTGYCTLNEYKHKTGLKDSPDCVCGETESVRHYIEDCELYESVREKLRVRLFQSGGIIEFKASVFLEVLKDDPYEQERINIMSVLEDYIRETKRFEKK